MGGREDVIGLLGLRRIFGVGGVSWARLVEAFGSAGTAMGLPLEALKGGWRSPRRGPGRGRPYHTGVMGCGLDVTYPP